MDWIGEGVRFECQACADCCIGPGYVWVTLEEIERIAEALGLDLDTFGARFLVRVGHRLSLREARHHRCILLGEDGRCTVYEVRPRQCRTFPFWRQFMHRKRDWEALTAGCPGIGVGRLYSPPEIREIAEGHAET